MRDCGIVDDITPVDNNLPQPSTAPRGFSTRPSVDNGASSCQKTILEAIIKLPKAPEPVHMSGYLLGFVKDTRNGLMALCPSNEGDVSFIICPCQFLPDEPWIEEEYQSFIKLRTLMSSEEWKLSPSVDYGHVKRGELQMNLITSEGLLQYYTCNDKLCQAVAGGLFMHRKNGKHKFCLMKGKGYYIKQLALEDRSHLPVYEVDVPESNATASIILSKVCRNSQQS